MSAWISDFVCYVCFLLHKYDNVFLDLSRYGKKRKAQIRKKTEKGKSKHFQNPKKKELSDFISTSNFF